MTSLSDAMEGLADVVGAVLDRWTSYMGFELELACPAFVVGVPTAVSYGDGPQGRARYELPITGAVDVADAMTLADFLSRDGLAEQLQGARHDAWFGDLMVLRAGDTRISPNGNGECVAADLYVTFLA